MFTPYGYARQNIGDALAGTLILLWEVVNNADAFRHGPGIRSVRDSVHAVLAQKPKIQALSDAEKQRNAEIAKYGSIFFIDTCKQLRMAGDYESLRKCRDSAARAASRFGINPYRTSFTLEEQHFLLLRPKLLERCP
jgi:hypothetical protein